MSTQSPYKNYVVPTNLGDAGLWGGYLNTTLGTIDTNLGGVLTLQSSASPAGVTLTSTEASNLAYVVQGVLGQDYPITFTSSLGGNGIYVINNETTGSFSVSVTQTSSLATALTIPQGGRSIVYGDGTTFQLADDNQTAKLYSYLGSPQGNVAGTAATANAGATNIVRDVTNQINYACKVTGSSSTALWIPAAGLPQVGGYLTVSTDANNPVPTTDFAGVASVFWTPLTSNWCWASDGTAVFPVQFSRMTLTLTNVNNAANQLQDVYYYWNDGTPVIGTGPTWAAGAGGSVTAGACARGTGVGGAAVARVQGVWTNTVAMTINNGGNAYVMGVGEGVLIGSVFIDSAAGQTTCHRSAGQNRKWGVWNPFNAAPVKLRVMDSTASWTYNLATVRQSNGAGGNRATYFSGLQTQPYMARFGQRISCTIGANTEGIGIGADSTVTVSGRRSTIGTNTGVILFDTHAEYTPAAGVLGISNINCLEAGDAAAAPTFYGTEANMLMTVEWNA